MIFDEGSDSEGDEVTSSLRIPFPVLASADRHPSSSQTTGHKRSPSLPTAPQVNVEEVDRPNEQKVPSPRPRAHHVKAPSADWAVDFERKGSPADYSMDSDSTCSRQESPQPGSAFYRYRSETADSDTLVLSLANRDAMPMEKRGSEISEAGSLQLPTPRGMISEDSGEEGVVDTADTDSKLLYLMVARCIAYPFNAKYQLETAPPKPKLNEERFKNVVEMLDACRNKNWDVIQRSAISLNGIEYKCIQSEKFQNCLDWYMEHVMEREDVVRMSKSGSYSVKELESIFKVLATKHITYTSKDQLLDTAELQTWCSTFRKLVEHSARGIRSGGLVGLRSPSPTNGNGGTGPNREKLYKLFQKILHIKSIEHQILYRVCQVSRREGEGGGGRGREGSRREGEGESERDQGGRGREGVDLTIP